MIRVAVFVDTISAERLWDIEKPVPSVQISTSINVLGINQKNDELLEIPFSFNVSYNPRVAQIHMEGKSHVVGSKEELSRINSVYEEKKPLPPIISQSLSNAAFVESVLVCRILNVPPPVPLPRIPEEENEKPMQKSHRS